MPGGAWMRWRRKTAAEQPGRWRARRRPGPGGRLRQMASTSPIRPATGVTNNMPRGAGVVPAADPTQPGLRVN
jgi:hypothetical protein